MADIEVLDAALDDEPVVRRLLESYMHDFSEMTDADVGTDGSFGYPDLDNYWDDPQRHPFLFRVDGRWAGFALVHAGNPHDMAEFFVMRKYRRHGVGVAAARSVFARFPGPWQVRQVTANVAATQFWRRAIPVEFDEDLIAAGPVQRFVIVARS